MEGAKVSRERNFWLNEARFPHQNIFLIDIISFMLMNDNESGRQTRKIWEFWINCCDWRACRNIRVFDWSMTKTEGNSVEFVCCKCLSNIFLIGTSDREMFYWSTLENYSFFDWILHGEIYNCQLHRKWIYFLIKIWINFG